MNYYNGEKSYSNLTWLQGRQLASVTVDGSIYNYSYDGDGIRTQKIVDGVAHTYVTQNGKVVRETIGTGTTAKILDFIYDNSGKPFALIYTNGTAEPETYYYVLNLQGDVVALMTADRTIVARYTYNAWGKLLSVTDKNGNAITSASHIANLNPIRYRGYYYDTETGFYYLQSRYYDPASHRFINADSQFDWNAGFVGANLFAYCANNPVIFSDYSGESIILACICIGAIIGGGVGAYVSYKATGDVDGWAIVAGSIVGGLIGWGVGAVIAAAGAASTCTVAGTVAQASPEIYHTWQSAEQALRNVIGSASDFVSRVFSTPFGNRVVDAYNASTGVIAEAKYGYQSLSGFIQSEITRDAWLLEQGLVTEVQWHFYFSEASKTMGGSYSLIRALLDAGIQVIFH